MNSGNYEGTYSQSEVTGEGAFDYREMAARKDAALTGIDKNQCYPNVTDINLGVSPGEPLVYRLGVKGETRSGAQRLAVFSSFNGRWFGRYKTKELNRRTLAYAGCSKTQINYGQAQGGSSQTQTGLSWIKTGESAFNQNSGNECIIAGDLVYLDMPSTSPKDWPLSGSGSTFVSPNNPSGGMPVGKYIMVTRPYNPLDFHSPLETYAALMATTKASDVPGVSDLSFDEFYQKTPGLPFEKTLSCAQQGSASLLFAIIGIWANVQRTLLAENVDTTDVMEVLVAEFKIFDAAREPLARKCIDACLLQNTYGNKNRKDAIDALEQIENGNAVLAANANPVQREAFAKARKNEKRMKMLCQDALQNLLGANAEMAYETNRWIIGRATKNSAPGQKLVVNVGAFTRPSSY